MAKHVLSLTLAYDEISGEQWFSVETCGDERISGFTNVEPFDCSNTTSVLASLSTLLRLLMTVEASPSPSRS